MEQIEKTVLRGIPHEGREISFQFPAFEGNYAQIAKQINDSRLQGPTSKEVASFIYDAFRNQNKEGRSRVIGILENYYLLEFTGNLYLPKSNEEINNGLILEDNPTITEGRLIMDKKNLIRRLQEGDPEVRFVPFSLEKRPYLVARYGEEGAEKILESSLIYEVGIEILTPEPVKEEIARISTIDNFWNFGRTLNVGGDTNPSQNVYAFGKLPSN